jgi:nucleoid-associated protein YgaU
MLEHATIAVQWQDELEFIPVQFNPTELSLDKGAQIAEIAIPGLDSPLLQFVRGQNERLTLDLFFDTTEQGMGAGATSVTTLTDRIYELVKIEPGRHAPPVCTFLWNSKFPGNDTSVHIGNQRRNGFDCVVESVKQKFMLFSPEGVPLRATVTVTFREYKTLDQQLRQLNLHSPDHTQSHIVQHGDTLSGIAARYYRRPGEWRRIAVANGIEDPRRLIVGTLLVVPRIE